LSVFDQLFRNEDLIIAMVHIIELEASERKSDWRIMSFAIFLYNVVPQNCEKKTVKIPKVPPEQDSF